MEASSPIDPKVLEVVLISPPPEEERVNRGAEFAGEGEKKGRYSLPDHLQSSSPVGYRQRVSITEDEAKSLMPLLSLQYPTGFVSGPKVTEQELFEESSLAILSSRQSTNFKGQKQVTFGPDDSERIAGQLRTLSGLKVDVLEEAAYTHVVFTRPYRTPFTMLLTLVGHLPLLSLVTVPIRMLRKRFQHIDDIPTIGYLQQLHLGILADAMERASVIASGGRRRAQVHIAPFCGGQRKANKGPMRKLADLCGLTRKERATGWRVGMVVQVGYSQADEVLDIAPETFRKLGANLMAFRSERIQPGVNAEEKAPPAYQSRQSMDVSEAFTVMAGRAAYNAFAHWTRTDRELAKERLLLDRVDVLTPNGKARLRAIRKDLEEVTDMLIRRLPLWADLPVGRLFSRNAGRGRKAFALVGQRIYIAGLSPGVLKEADLDWELAVCAVGASASRSALYVELMGTVNLPSGCDLLAGICMMAGPVNQNDIGKQFFGRKDLLSHTYDAMDPTSLLVWTLKAKTVADPIGNEEQLLNAKRKGALVDLRCGPHELIGIMDKGQIRPFRKVEDRVNTERAFAEAGNFVTASDGREIPGNRGSAWPENLRHQPIWSTSEG